MAAIVVLHCCWLPAACWVDGCLNLQPWCALHLLNRCLQLLLVHQVGPVVSDSVSQAVKPGGIDAYWLSQRLADQLELWATDVRVPLIVLHRCVL